MRTRLQDRMEAQEAGRQGRPNPVERKDASDEALVRFHAWHLATVERQLGIKLLAGAPAPDEPDMMICRPKESKTQRDEL